MRTDDFGKIILSEEWRNIVVKWENVTRDIIFNDRLQ